MFLFISLGVPAKNVRRLKGHTFFICWYQVAQSLNQFRVAIRFTRNRHTRIELFDVISEFTVFLDNEDYFFRVRPILLTEQNGRIGIARKC